MSRALSWRSTVGAALDEEGDGYLLGLLRVALAALLILQTAKIGADSLARGYFGDVFHLPVVPELLVPAAPLYYALLGVQLAGGLLALVGWRGREALLAAAVAGLYLLLCDRLQYHNNRFVLLLVALLAAFTPCDRSFLLYRGRRHAFPAPDRRGPLFARYLIQFQISLVYLASGGGKLFDPDWRGGQVLLVRHERVLEFLTQRGVELGESLKQGLQSPLVASLTAKAAISLELFLAVGLWFGRTRPVALVAGLLFHVGIELTSRVELFSWVMASAYLAFLHAADPTWPPAWVRRVARRLGRS